MTQRAILWGRVLGVVVSLAFVFAVAALTEFSRRLWTTMQVVWSGPGEREDGGVERQAEADRTERQNERRRVAAEKRRKQREKDGRPSMLDFLRTLAFGERVEAEAPAIVAPDPEDEKAETEEKVVERIVGMIREEG